MSLRIIPAPDESYGHLDAFEVGFDFAQPTSNSDSYGGYLPNIGPNQGVSIIIAIKKQGFTCFMFLLAIPVLHLESV